jgi:hypothetical protein
VIETYVAETKAKVMELTAIVEGLLAKLPAA